MKIAIAVAGIIIGLVMLNDIDKRDYTGLTPRVYPDIAIDIFPEVPVPYGNTGHKLSKKRITKSRKINLGSTRY